MTAEHAQAVSMRRRLDVRAEPLAVLTVTLVGRLRGLEDLYGSFWLLEVIRFLKAANLVFQRSHGPVPAFHRAAFYI